MTRQRLVSVDWDPKNRSYIDSSGTISNLSNKELLTELVELDRTPKIQTGDEPISLLQTRSQQYLRPQTSTYHYSENAISNGSPVARLANKYYTIYSIKDDDVIYVWSKEYGEHIQFLRDHKFNLYYMDINEADMNEHWCPNTVKQALECTSIVLPTIMDQYKDIHLNIDLLSVNKMQILLTISWNLRFMHSKTLLSKHNKNVQNRLQQIVQSRRFKDVFTVVDWAFKNIVDWVRSNLYIDLTNCTVDLQVYITKDVIQVVNDIVKQEVTPDRIQFYQMFREAILSDLFTNSDLYDDNSYASYADWKIERKLETDLKKIEFNIDKPDIDLMKIEFNINVNDDEIDDMNNEEAVYLNDGLDDDNYTGIKDSVVQHEQDDLHNGFCTLVEN